MRGSWTLALVVLVGCGGPELQRGTVLTCADGVTAGEFDVNLELEGTISVATAEGCGGDHRFTVVTPDDGSVSFGVSLRDAEGNDLLAGFEPPATGSVHFRSRMVWGTVSGLVLSDADGLLLALDEGSWGSAFEDPEADVGIAIDRGPEVIAQESADCMPLEGYEIDFGGVSVIPVDHATVSAGGQEVQAWAMAAWDYGTSRSCQISDASGATSWALVR